MRVIVLYYREKQKGLIHQNISSEIWNQKLNQNDECPALVSSIKIAHDLNHGVRYSRLEI